MNNRNFIIHGIIAGIFVSVFMLFSANNIVNYNLSMYVGYASMLLAFSLIFVSTRNFRDKHNNGIISFGKAFKIGIMIVLIASTIYVVVWLITFYFFQPDFFEKCTTKMLVQMKVEGLSQIEIDKKAKEMADMAILVKNPFFNALITYTEILPVGIIVTLISSLILKRKVATN